MYQKLQNLATRSMLGAFKGTPYKAMEIETALLPPEVRFERLCNRYSIKTLLINAKHPIKQILIENTVDKLNPNESENTYKIRDYYGQIHNSATFLEESTQ